jgi:hypothetical protein
LDEIAERWISGTGGSVTKETVHYLMRRNIKKSERFPGKYFFTRDSRLRFIFPINYHHDVTCELIPRFTMPHINIKTLKGPYFEKKKYFNEALEIFKRNPKFENHFIDATHHVHLTEPEKIAPLITKFLEKHGRVDTTSKL